MRKRKWSARQRRAVLNAWDAGRTVLELCKKHDISRATLYLWKEIYTGMSTEAIERWDKLARERAVFQRQLKCAKADRALLQAVLQTLELTVEQKCRLVRWSRAQHLSSATRTCVLLRLSRSKLKLDAMNEAQFSHENKQQ
ncbi:transposase [Mycetohabitans sp. B5]|uniref:Transposase n=1 Tax=Mycetohabitans endofungorum TaxID=417203 RepID=A0A2P5K6H2_9BURK|nr:MULTISPECIES: transposase [Mycetohabitans]MCG1055028.1 transposase [Mycetohabitans sp. B5]PPB80129.1 transposase [Mycetohabitans endofungorum]